MPEGVRSVDFNYQYAESTVRPPEIETNANAVYLRKSYEQITRGEGEEQVTYWTYQEAKLTQQEFSEYITMITAENAIKGQNDSANISSLVSGQSTNEFYQLAIMEAIADLYEAMTLGS